MLWFVKRTTWLTFALLAACQQDKTEPLGEVQQCGVGLYFSLQEQACLPLKGFQFLQDTYGFERVQLSNGLEVPKRINGTSPFVVSFAYSVSQASSFEVVVKRQEFGVIGSESYSSFEKVKVPEGQGIAKVRLFPKDGLIPPGGPAQRVEERWQEEQGYLIEIKGGDRFEDEDGDPLKSWRVAGLDVDPRAVDDPDGKIFSMEAVGLAKFARSCEPLSFELEFQKTDIDLELAIALKEPANQEQAWFDWGSTLVRVPAGTRGRVPLTFLLKSKEGACPPAGPAVDVARWDAVPGAYVIQIDAFDKRGQKLNLSGSEYQVSQTTIGLNITAPVTSGPAKCSGIQQCQ